MKDPDNLTLPEEQGGIADVNRLIIAALPEIKAIARQVIRRVRGNLVGINSEDLVQEGAKAFLGVLPKFDPNLGTSPIQFARERIEGAMRDALRKTPMAGDARSGARLALSLDAINDHNQRPLDGLTAAGDHAGADEILERNQAGDLIRQDLSQLPGKERRVIQALFFDGKTEREVGDELGVGESRISQIKSAALRHLQEIYNEREHRVKVRQKLAQDGVYLLDSNGTVMLNDGTVGICVRSYARHIEVTPETVRRAIQSAGIQPLEVPCRVYNSLKHAPGKSGLRVTLYPEIEVNRALQIKRTQRRRATRKIYDLEAGKGIWIEEENYISIPDLTNNLSFREALRRKIRESTDIAPANLRTARGSKRTPVYPEKKLRAMLAELMKTSPTNDIFVLRLPANGILTFKGVEYVSLCHYIKRGLGLKPSPIKEALSKEGIDPLNNRGIAIRSGKCYVEVYPRTEVDRVLKTVYDFDVSTTRVFKFKVGDSCVKIDGIPCISVSSFLENYGPKHYYGIKACIERAGLKPVQDVRVISARRVVDVYPLKELRKAIRDFYKSRPFTPAADL